MAAAADPVIAAKNKLGQVIQKVINNVDWDGTNYNGTFTKSSSGGGKKMRKGGGLIEDVSNLGGLVQNNHSPASFASSDGLSTLLGTPPSATANIHLHENSAYLLNQDNYLLLDRQVHGGKKKVKKVKK